MAADKTSCEFSTEHPGNDTAVEQGSPPAYSTGSNSKASARTLILYHRKPGQLSPRNKVKTGDVIEKFEDVIMISAKISFDSMWTKVNERIKTRFEIDLVQDTTARGVILVRMKDDPGRTISADEGNWEAVRVLVMEKKKGDFEVHFALVPDGWTGSQKKKCVVM